MGTRNTICCTLFIHSKDAILISTSIMNELGESLKPHCNIGQVSEKRRKKLTEAIQKIVAKKREAKKLSTLKK